MKRILLVGATGRIGGATAEALRTRGVSFSTLTWPGAKTSPLGEADSVLADVRDVASLKRAFSGFDALLSVSPFAADIDHTGANMVAAAKAAGVARIVRTSALGAAHDAAITLGRLHAAAEDAVRRSGLEWTILRPATFMQNYLDSAATIRSNGAVHSPLGEGRVSIVDVRNVGEMAAAALVEEGHVGQVWAVTGPVALSGAEIAALMSVAFGRPIRYEAISDERAENAMRNSGMPDPLVAMVGELNAMSRAGGAAFVSTDVQRILGRAPHSFADFLHANASVFGAEALR